MTLTIYIYSKLGLMRANHLIRMVVGVQEPKIKSPKLQVGLEEVLCTDCSHSVNSPEIHPKDLFKVSFKVNKFVFC